MGNRIEHKCEENLANLPICCAEDTWTMRGSGFSWGIAFCPYCGVKLEPPDVKIEVRRETMRGIVHVLWEAHSLLQKGFPANAKGMIANEAEYIESLLTND